MPPKFQTANAEKICQIHGAYLAKGFGFGEMVFWTDCPRCEVEKARVEQQAQTQPLAPADLARMNIQPMFYDADFDTFSAESAELQQNLAVLRRFCVVKRGKILLSGANGTGKTHLACAALKQFRAGRIYTMFEIGVLLRNAYQHGANREKEVLDMLVRTPLLVIDELGRTSGKDWEKDWCSHIINKRHENYKPLIIISNLKREYLANRIGGDILSRFDEDGIILSFTGEDYRIKMRLQTRGTV
jgi:DNA replication protein DnaC